MTSGPLTNPEIRRLKATAQRLEPMTHIGKNGLTPAVIHSVLQALDSHELIKVKFIQDREERDQLAHQLAAATESHLIMQVGKVAVYFRPKPQSESQP